MKKNMLLLLAFCLLLTGAACGGRRFPDPPADAVGFPMGTYVDEGDDDAMYGVVTFEGRTYMPYGTLKNRITPEDADVCIGWLVQDETEDRDERLYTLRADPEHNFLMQRYAGESVMDQPTFWRAADTKGKSVSVPDYIESLGYGFWGE